MNIETFRAFAKEASILTDVGMKILTKARALPRVVAHEAAEIPHHIRGGIDNAGKAVSAFSTPVDSLKRGLKMTTSDFGNMSTAQKALMVTGLAGSAHEGLAKEDPYRQGRGRIERAATAVGDQLGGLVGTPFGLAGGFVGSQIGRKAGMLAGKGAEGAAKLLKRKQPQPAPALP